MKKVIVIGAGIVGAASAFALHQQGFDVTVIDTQSSASDVQSATYANGAQLSYSYVEPLASPATLRALPKLLLSADSPLSFTPRWSLDQWRWGLNFLRYCNSDSVSSTTRAMLALGQLSRAQLEQWQQKHDWQYSFAQPGKLVLFNQPSALKHAAQQVALQAPHGAHQQVISAQECAQIEPALTPMIEQFAGGVYTPSECVADGRLLARAMAQPVRLMTATRAIALLHDAQGVRGVQTTAGELLADAVVIANGYLASPLLQNAGLKNHVYPIKGYSITLKIERSELAPTVSITDTRHKLVYARLQRQNGDVLRIAGRAEVGTDVHKLEQRHIDSMCVQADRLFNGACSFDAVEPWVGLRPATPSGRPIIGKTPIAGLFVNVGHGALGLTMACGAAALLADAITNQQQHTLLAQQFQYH